MEIYPFVLYMACGGMISIKKNSHFRKKNFFCFISLNFLNVISAPYTLKGSRNFQGFALIRAVLFVLVRVEAK